MTLAMGGWLFRVVCTDADLLDVLRREFDAYRYASDALLGFKMAEEGGLWILISGSGEVLARSREPRDVFGSLIANLVSLEAGAPEPGSVRLAARALVRADGTATLVGPQPEVFGPWIEKRLARAGMALVDMPFVDLDTNGRLAVVPDSFPRFDAWRPGTGHRGLGGAGGELIERVVIPAIAAPFDEVGQALAAATLASASRSGTLAERLHVAATVAVNSSIVVAAGGPREIYRVLDETAATPATPV